MNTQIDRLISRDSLSRAEAQTRINSQMPLSEKVRSSDYVIDNSGTLEETLDQVKQFVWQKILSGK
jgi:dephospho-CoA kinase